MVSTREVLHASATPEWYTPVPYIEAARRVMGSIDLDPASCEFANRVVRASRYYTVAQNGLTREWFGNVWLNSPYGRQGNASVQGLWNECLLQEYRCGHVQQAITLVGCNPAQRWFAPLWDYLACFPDRLIKFYNEQGVPDQPSHAHVLFYLGDRTQEFAQEFCAFGPIVKLYHRRSA